MKSVMLGLIAETAIHCGAGRSAGVVDLPIAREAATDYPFIPGSGLKGSMRDRSQQRGRSDFHDVFGKSNQAGTLLFSDVRLILLPVRSLTGAYRWLTCPLLLERYSRDLVRCGIAARLPPVNLARSNGIAGILTDGKSNELCLLEEREFIVSGECPKEVIDAIAPLIRHRETRARLQRQIAVVADDDFAWFCRYALPIQARNVLDDETKQSKNLWYEESLPPDTVLYALLIPRDAGAKITIVEDIFPDTDPYLQIGGNETVGHGWVAVSVRNAEVSS